MNYMTRHDPALRGDAFIRFIFPNILLLHYFMYFYNGAIEVGKLDDSGQIWLQHKSRFVSIHCCSRLSVYLSLSFYLSGIE